MFKLFKKEKTFKKEKQSLWLNINLYWKVAVGFMFLAFLLSLFFSRYLFTQINKELVSSTSGTSPQVETVKKDRIDKVLEYFSEREKKSNEILNSPAPLIDPSL